MTNNQNESFQHHGILGMKWGRRKYQDKSGKRTAAGKQRDKSRRRLTLEAKYSKKGYSDKESSEKAARRHTVEKVLLGTLAAVAIGSAAYVGYREYGKRFKGVTLEKGKELHYINKGDSIAKDLNRRLYTSFEKEDTKKYKGLLAKSLSVGSSDNKIFDTVLQTTEKIKAPSQRDAKKLYAEFLKSNPNLPKQTYNQFNRAMVTSLYNKSSSGSQFTEFLKTKGYNAILDANDQFKSGYSTKKPLILFNASSSVKKVAESQIPKNVTNRLNAIQMAKVNAKALSPFIGLGAAAYGGSSAMNSKSKHGAVNKYIQQNSSSNTSYSDVYNALEQMDDGSYKVNKSKL